MKPIEKLCMKFDRKYPAYISYPDYNSSYRGHYKVWIKDMFNGLCSVYIFTTTREFAEWIDGVVLY